MATMPVAGNEQVQELSLTLVVPSKDNPRKSFDGAAMDELVESIRLHGVTSPVLARPKDGKFELIYGERRLRGSRKAGKETIPVIVRELTDEQADAIRFVENLNREDLSPMEEAKGYEKHYKGIAAADIAAKLGKPESHVVLRLRLLTLIDGAQKALNVDQILLGHALELCKLRDEEQKQALKWLLSARVDVNASEGQRFDEVKTHYSVEALKRYIQANFLLVLAHAPFDTNDPTLNPSMGSCMDCKFNTANLGTLFPGVKEARCTVPDCFAVKTNKSLLNEIDAVGKETGKKVLRLGIGQQYYNRGISKNMVDRYYTGESDRSIAEVKPGMECESAMPAVVTWIDPSISVKATIGKRLTVCADEKCKVHHARSERAPGTPRKGLELVEHKAEVKASTLGQRVRDEAFKALAERLLAQAKLGGKKVSFECLLTYAKAHLHMDRFRDLGKAIGLERPEKADEFRGPDWEGAVVKHFASNPSALILAIVAAEGLQDADADSPLYRMAAEYKVDVKKIEKVMAAEDKAEIGEMKERAKAKQKAETKKATELKELAASGDKAKGKEKKAAKPKKAAKKKR